MTPMPVLTDPRLRPGASLLAEGRAMARDWSLGSCPFLTGEGVSSESEYKLRAARAGRIMQHAHIGFRRIDRTVDGIARLHDEAQARGVTIDRFGITLDWSMGYPPDRRASAGRGTGIVLTGPEDFARITHASPAAAHFGDFMLGLPGALENCRAALVAGATAIGNLGQYFTFRLPFWDDDVATTHATVTALGLIAAQPAQVLVHSNLDDGFAGLFTDLTSAFGMALIERHIVEDLIGAKASFCFGHHFSSPLTRTAFQRALARRTDTPGTMIFGNTVSYRSNAAGNFASLASYLLADIGALMRHNSGHAINPVPVTENLRIPDLDEILDAQTFAARLVEQAPGHLAMWEIGTIDALADQIEAGGQRFARRVLAGLGDRGVDSTDPAALMLAIRRLGAKRIEALWGEGEPDGERRRPRLPADWAEELDTMADRWLAREDVAATDLSGLRVAIGTTDVHEHGAYLVTRTLNSLGAEVIDAGTAVDPDVLVARAIQAEADVIAISTYNGIALSYARAVLKELEPVRPEMAVLIGGKLNQIPETSNSDLPVDVTTEIAATGAFPCADLDAMLDALLAHALRRQTQTSSS